MAPRFHFGVARSGARSARKMTLSKELMQLDRILMRNPLSDWLVACGAVLAIVLVVALIKRLAIRRLLGLAQRKGSRVGEAVVCAVRGTRLWLIFLVALQAGAQYLLLPHKTEVTLDKLVTVAAFLQLGLWLAALLDFWITRSRDRAMQTDVGAATSLAAMAFVGRMILWAVMLLLVMDNLGVNITALVASLGVGGVAVALAVQNILGDLFASLSIVIDKPFVLGDFIEVDDHSGTVEHVGLKTTRVRSLSGEQLVFSNSDLLKARVRNFKRMRERRVVFAFGVLYQTPVEQLERIPGIVRDIVEAQPRLRFERSHFKAFGDSAYEFETVYWVLDADYGVYMDAQQTVNLALLRAFERQRIEFAYPTRSVLLEGAIGVRLNAASSPLQASETVAGLPEAPAANLATSAPQGSA
jgi:small-conductance mechanosensitive channel